MSANPKLIHIVFDGPPGPDGPRFIEVEDAEGNSLRVGEWHKLRDRWVLRLWVEARCFSELAKAETFEMHDVESGNVARVGYKMSTQQLAVEYLDGTRYHYADVARDLFAELLDADSVGSFLNRRIHSVHTYERIS